MKISICGKGGSGKSTIVTLLANEFKARGYRVVVVDSDESNSGLYRMLGFDHPPIPLMELVGSKKGLKERMAVKFSSGESEPKMEKLTLNKILVKDIPPQHIKESDGLRLVNIGKILHSLEGCACPMGVLSREFLAKLYLDEGEIAIVDMEAGVEHFGRGIETSIDEVLAVVEPSFESLELALKVKQLAAGAGVKNTWAILNKITSDEIAMRLKDELARRGLEVIGIVHHDPKIFEACLEGHRLEEGVASKDIRGVVDAVLSKT
ncbi:MAG: P-loop NTPase [Chloroflexi bacterium]|nr:P-loop NTPase [Chloroflexota bacterium]MBL7061361.1 P-loop NTPase [Dehalococcoidia bacterium]